MAVRRNYITDPASVNGYLSGWGAGVTPTLEADTPMGMPAGFDHCTKIAHTSGAWQARTAGIDHMAVVPGETYHFSCYLAAADMAGDDLMMPEMHLSLDDGETTRTQTMTYLNTERAWTRYATFVTIAAGENRLSLAFIVGAGTGTYYVTGELVEEAAVPGDYFDGSYPWSAWAGEENASVSITVADELTAAIAAIQAKTDLIPASPAAVGSAMVLTSAYDKAKDDVLTPLAIVGDTVDAVKLKSDTIGGAGAIEWTYTLTTPDGAPIPDAEVWVTTDEAGNNVVASGRTNAFGVVTFHLDPGGYFIWAQKSGTNFDNPDFETVTA